MKYYNGDKILNNPQPFNFLLGNRGIGKSFYWKRYMLRKYNKHRRKFIYVRRYKSDLDKVVNNLFDDVLNTFNDVKILYEKGFFYWVEDDVKEICGMAIAVTEFTKYKSANFDEYDTIMFDEFLPEDGKYIGGKQKPFLEPELCLNFYQTVARGYNKVIRDEVMMLFISNSVTIANPYFMFYNIDKKLKLDTKFIKGQGFNVEINRNMVVSEEIRNSKFGALIQGTDYERYALGNEFYLDSDDFIVPNPDGIKQYVSSMFYDGVVYAIYVVENMYWITDKPDMDYPVRFSLTLKDHSLDSIMLSKLDVIFKILRKYYQYGRLIFKNQRCKKFFESIIK